MSKIVERLTKLRKAAGWSQNELAKRIGTSAAAVNNLEIRNKGLSFKHLVAYSKIFSFSLDELLELDSKDFAKNSEKDGFYIRFQDLRKLSKGDLELVLTLCRRLLK